MAVRKSWRSQLIGFNALAAFYLVLVSGWVHAGTTPLDVWNDWILAIDHPDAACTSVSSAEQVVKVCSWNAPLTGKPEEARQAFSAALTLLGDSPLAAYNRAFDLADWLIYEYSVGDCRVAAATWEKLLAAMRPPS